MEKELLNKLEPKNKEMAFYFQFEDDLKLLKSGALLDSKTVFEHGLQRLEAHIISYREEK